MAEAERELTPEQYQRGFKVALKAFGGDEKVAKEAVRLAALTNVQGRSFELDEPINAVGNAENLIRNYPHLAVYGIRQQAEIDPQGALCLAKQARQLAGGALQRMEAEAQKGFPPMLAMTEALFWMTNAWKGERAAAETNRLLDEFLQRVDGVDAKEEIFLLEE